MIQPKGLIFDLDGVIVTTEHNHFVAWKRTADQLGIPFTEKENESIKGLSRIDSLRTILEIGNVSLPQEEIEILLLEKNNFYRDSIAELSRKDLLPGVLDLLNQAKEQNIPMAVGSASRNAVFIISLLELDDYFVTIIDGNKVSDPKPHPEVFLNAAAALGLKPADCIVFEDADSGIKAAKAGGFFAIAVGNPSIASLADMYLNDLTEFKLNIHA
jgi:beta-phosphoglucomutase